MRKFSRPYLQAIAEDDTRCSLKCPFIQRCDAKRGYECHIDFVELAQGKGLIPLRTQKCIADERMYAKREEDAQEEKEERHCGTCLFSIGSACPSACGDDRIFSHWRSRREEVIRMGGCKPAKPAKKGGKGVKK